MDQQEKNKLYNKAFTIAFRDRFDESYVSLFENLKDILPKDIIKPIESFGYNSHNPKDGIIIIGDDFDLANGIVSYFWFTHPCLIKKEYRFDSYDELEEYRNKMGYKYSERFNALWDDIEMHKLKYADYTGWKDEHIEATLFPQNNSETPLNYYYMGEILFLRGVCCGCIKRLITTIRNVKFSLGVCGTLIINVTEIPAISQKDLDRFEVISIVPEKQDVQKTSAKVKDVPFTTLSGAQWNEVKISFIDDENVKISIRDKIEKKHYSQIGFKDNRSNNKPVKSWYILLDFREKESLKFSQNNKSKIEKGIQDLRKRLRAYFGIQENPIALEHGYKPKFEVSRCENQGHSVHVFSNSNLFVEKEEG